MSAATRHTTAYWLLFAALTASCILAAHFVVAAWSGHSAGTASTFQPATVEQVVARAAPFQAQTKETEGLFRIVQEQHAELDLQFASLSAFRELNRSMALVGAIAFTSLSLVLTACLLLLSSPRRQVEP
jgi:hypothetical protein